MDTETVTRVRATLVPSPYSGEHTYLSWDDPDLKDMQTLTPAQPRPSTEPTESGRDATVSGYILYLDDRADVLATDRMHVRGATHKVVGDPEWWPDGGLKVVTELMRG